MEYTFDNWDIEQMDKDLSAELADIFVEESKRLPDIPIDIEEIKKMTYFAKLEELAKVQNRDVKELIKDELGDDFYQTALTQLREGFFDGLRERIMESFFSKNDNVARAEQRFFAAFVQDTVNFETLKAESPIFNAFASQIHPTRIKIARRTESASNYSSNFTMIVLAVSTFGLLAIPYIIARHNKKKRMKELAKDRFFRQLCYILKESKWLTDSI